MTSSRVMSLRESACQTMAPSCNLPTKSEQSRTSASLSERARVRRSESERAHTHPQSDLPTSMAHSIHEHGTLDRIIWKYVENRGLPFRGRWGSTRLWVLIADEISFCLRRISSPLSRCLPASASSFFAPSALLAPLSHFFLYLANAATTAADVFRP